MDHIHSNSNRPAIAVLILVLASLALAACGGSSTSSSSSTTTNASATTSTAGGTGSTSRPRGPLGGRFLALRECMQKNGITLPKRKPGQRPGIGGFLGGAGGPQLPAGVTRAQYEAALKKCGGFQRARLPGAGGAPFTSPAAKQALAKFAACMRSNGVNLPEPNTSGKGPIFNTKGLSTSSKAFRAAEIKCRSELLGAFRARPGAGKAAGAAGGSANG